MELFFGKKGSNERIKMTRLKSKKESKKKKKEKKEGKKKT